MSFGGLGHLVGYWSRFQGSNAALVYEGQRCSWRQLDERTDALAAGLARVGVGRGDRVGILMENHPAFIETTLAAMKLGGITVPFNIRSTSHELAFPLADSAPAVVVTDAALGAKLTGVADAALYAIDDGPGQPLSSLYRWGETPPEIDVYPDDGAFLCYTSGTTGYPKGVLLTHDNIIAAAIARTHAHDLRQGDRQLLPFSLCFTGGIVVGFAQMMLFIGGTTIFDRTFDPGQALRIMTDERVSVFVGPTVFFEMMAGDSDFKDADLSAWRVAQTGGSVVPEPLLLAYLERNVPIVNGYGLTESGGGSAFLNPRDCHRKLGSVGVPVVGTAIRIVDDDGVDLGFETDGEIIIRARSVMKGYWNNEDATRDAVRDGWLHTGDVGRFDEEGFLSIIDRTKDMIRSGGISVYPAEIERVIAGLPNVVDIAVIGVPDERWQETTLAVVYTEGRELDLSQFVQTCTEQLADYKRPRYLVHADAPLPRSLSGKIRKVDLRAAYPGAPAHARRLSYGAAQVGS